MSASADRFQSSLSTAGYTDGLGRRSIRFDREVGGMLECLELRPEFGLYEALLRDAARILSTIRDERISRIQSIERQSRGLLVLSPLVPGQRLEELLEARSADEYAGPGIDAALGFLVQALPALSLLHDAGLVHGTIAPGRIALTAAGAVVLLDGIYASVVDRLRLNRHALWSALAVAAPATIGGVTCDRGGDVRQLSLAALAIALGRPLQDAYKPDVVARLLQEVTEVAQIRGGERFAVDLRSLLGDAAGSRPDAAPLAQVAAEAQRLARSLGTETCQAALTELARFQVYSSEPLSHGRVTPVRTAAPVRLVPPAVEPEPEPIPAPGTIASLPADLSLDLSESVEISLDGADEPDVLELELPPHDALVVSIERTGGRNAFDWTPDADSLPHTVEATQVAAHTPAEFDWSPDPAPVQEPEPDARTLAPAASVAPAVEDAPEPPAPPPGIPLYRPAASQVAVPAPVPTFAPAPVVAAPAVAAPMVSEPSVSALPPPPQIPPHPTAAPPSDRTGMRVYAPPLPVALAQPPVPVVVPVPPPMPFTPAPAIPVVAAPAPSVQAPVTVRLKTEDPVGHVRPRGTLTADRAVDRELLFGRISEPRPSNAAWKFAAAAGVVLAIGAFAGRPYLDGRIETPAAAETVPPPVQPAPAAASNGGLQIETQPSGAVVLLNGEDVGRTPLKLDTIKPGRHVVTLSTESATVRRTVRIEAGKVVTLDVPVYSGWVAIYSPVRLHVAAGPRSLGTTENTRIMLSPGRHELTFTNRELGYSAKETVEIVPGEERVLNLEPKGSVSVNALPWAEVWIDGTRMGETPLANLEVPLGTREFVFKHPTYGERRITTVITAKAPPLSVDFTKPGTRP